jgi:hypothetical protein
MKTLFLHTDMLPVERSLVTAVRYVKTDVLVG